MAESPTPASVGCWAALEVFCMGRPKRRPPACASSKRVHGKKRPSGHDISEKFSIDNGAAIPPNLIAVAHTESNSYYLRYCKEKGIEPHPARFPANLPEYFIRMLTDPGAVVVDPFAGSCVTGEVCERLKRKWLCGELIETYLKGAIARFKHPDIEAAIQSKTERKNFYYKVFHPANLWNRYM